MSNELVILGREGDQIDAVAAIYGITTSLALALIERITTQGTCRPLERQRRALTALANALAVATCRQNEPGFLADAQPGIIKLMLRADRAERDAVPHHKLLRLPAEWPVRRLAINAPTLGLFAAMRLRAALERQLLDGEDARRAAQFLVARDLERRLIELAQAFTQGKTVPEEAFEHTRNLFTHASKAIKDEELFEILGETDRRPHAPTFPRYTPEAARVIQ
jgi:hypothetical protein